MTMISPKRLIAMARKWKKLAATGRQRISIPRADPETCKKSAPSKGYFTTYTPDGRRFIIPLACLNSPIIQELLKMSEDEYGLPSEGPITIPCDVAFMEYVVSLLQTTMPKHIERALLTSMATDRCSTVSYMHPLQINQPILVNSY